MFAKALSLIKKHKYPFAAAVIAVGGLGWHFTHAGAAAETRYVLAAAEKGTLISTVTGSGQVAAENQLDVKAKASGDVYSVPAVKGRTVKTGAALAYLNARDALKAVRDAQSNLASARLSLKKLTQSSDALTTLQAQDALSSAKNAVTKLTLSQQISHDQTVESKQKAEDDLVKSYEDALNAVADAFLDFPTVTKGLDDILNSEDLSDSESTLGSGQDNVSALINSSDLEDADLLRPFSQGAVADQLSAQASFDATFAAYKTVTRFSDRAAVEDLLAKALETAKSVAQASKSESNFVDEWAQRREFRDRPVFPLVTQYQRDLATYIGQTNGHLSTLLSVTRSLQDDKNAITNAQRSLSQMDQNNPLDLAAAEATVAERQASLDKLEAGADTLDLQSSQLSVQQRLNALSDAQEKLGDYSVRAPFDGVLADVAVKKGDSISNGGVVATLITKRRTADITLNEVDVAKIALGEKATLTFDAIDGLELTGTVGDIDTIGTVSQGVVTYGVKLVFDTQDERVKPGMSVAVSIVTEAKTDVLTVPSTAVKTVGGASFVQMFDASPADASSPQGFVSATPPGQVPVEVGISNDTSTEIVSGLKEGDQVVSRTVTVTATKAATAQAPSLFGSPTAGRAAGGGGAGNAAFRTGAGR